jgi:CHAT domain-containing protein
VTALLGRPPSERSAAEQRALMDRLAALRRVLVPDSVLRRVNETREVVVVPDRSLLSLPFETLVVTPGSTLADARFWLDAAPPTRYVASATALYNIAQRADGRSATPPMPGATALSVSNPTFDPAPARAAQARRVFSSATGSAAMSVAVRAAFTTRAGVLPPLPGTAEESEALRRAFGGTGRSGASRVQVLQGPDATERRLRAALAGKRYVHLATHGVVDARRGALFAALALTPSTSDSPSADDDGLLQLYEIYDLHAPDAALVVLSACKTSAGADDEGVFALSQGFHAAGAPRVIGSQWNIADHATAVLMGAFFEGVAAAERSGTALDYATALRDAKRVVRRDARHADPFFWAPLVLSGTH